MKKLLLFIVPILVLIFAVSCSKSDDGNSDSGYTNVSLESLNGTGWFKSADAGGSKFNYVEFKGNRIAWARSSGYAYIIDRHFGTFSLSGDKLSVTLDETNEHYTFQIRYYKDSKGEVWLTIDEDAADKDKVPGGFYWKTDSHNYIDAHDKE